MKPPPLAFPDHQPRRPHLGQGRMDQWSQVVVRHLWNALNRYVRNGAARHWPLPQQLQNDQPNIVPPVALAVWAR